MTVNEFLESRMQNQLFIPSAEALTLRASNGDSNGCILNAYILQGLRTRNEYRKSHRICVKFRQIFHSTAQIKMTNGSRNQLSKRCVGRNHLCKYDFA